MIDDDIKSIINKRPVLITNFLRAAKNFTNNDWKILTEQILNNELNLNNDTRTRNV
jgi:hypothetical protein